MPDIYMDVDTALAEVPINLLPLIDDTDFKTIEAALVYNQAGLALTWNFITTGGAQTAVSVTPTSGGDYDWTDQGTNGLYSLEIPASGGVSANNDTEGFGWFTGVATGVLPWRGPVIGFRAAGLNNLLINSAYSTVRGLTGTALPNAVADEAGGLVISDAGSLDLDSKLANTNEITAARMGALADWLSGGRLDLLLAAIPTTAMRGTDSAALASICTESRLAELDAANLPAAITTAQNDLDVLTGVDGVTLATVQSLYAPNKVVPDAAGVAATKVSQDFMLKIITNKKALVKTDSIWELIVYDDDGVTPILQKDLKDADGNNVTDLAAGILAQELANSV